jgi:uncharacterized repeat protein (TIGR01451 family)
MRMLRRALFVVLAFCGAVTAAHTNNTFPGTVLSGTSGSITGTTVGATGETGEPASFGGGTLNTIWYSWTAPASGVFTIGTCNITSEVVTNFDTTLFTYTGAAVNALTVVTSNDDTTLCNSTVNANYASTNSFTATSGTTYRFQVDGYGSATGPYTLRWGLAALTVATTDNTAAEATPATNTAAFTVRPASPPAGGTSIVVTIGTSPQCTFAPSTLTFTTDNFTAPQAVTATATDDLVVEGTHSCSPASITASGGTYVSVSGTPPVLTVLDNDIAAFTIAKIQSAGSSPVTAAGQTLTYQITVANTGNVPLTGNSFSDVFQLGGSARSLTTGPTLSGDGAPVGTVNVGETWTYTATYIVPQSDINGSGDFTNQATFDTAETLPSSSAVVTTNVTRVPALSLNKTFVFTLDSNGNNKADVGDVITYTYAVANTGNVTINGVSIADVHNGYGSLSAITPASVATLAPGAGTTFTSTYTAVQGDIDNP